MSVSTNINGCHIIFAIVGAGVAITIALVSLAAMKEAQNTVIPTNVISQAYNPNTDYSDVDIFE